ncbi:MAG: Asp-tRNA(Asn)/Glu-tRNA(Gln) amidotransferase subunit GatB [Nanoarchaeota archaeon]
MIRIVKQFNSNIVIGLEVHVELNTLTKLFCSCSRHYEESEVPNSRVCPTCFGHPGSKPVLNRVALEKALKLALALNCKIAAQLIFSRKSYFYPDMSKNYQITQYEEPLGRQGQLKLSSGRIIHITRMHMEEDPASLIHSGSYVLVDYNRSGNPLVEVVTAPELCSPQEARDLMKQLVILLEYLEIFDNDECVIKADANISVKSSGYTRVEIKNITGFKEIESALCYEIKRQLKDIKDGIKIQGETRGWDAQKQVTYSMRSKESEEDYGYIIDADLVPINISQALIKQIRDTMPELADAKTQRFATKGVLFETAKVISSDKDLAEFLESVIEKGANPSLAANWVRRELVRVLKHEKVKLRDSRLTPQHMADLIELIETNVISEKTGQRIIEKLAQKSFDVKAYVKEEGLSRISDASALEQYAKEVIAEHISAVKDYHSGEEKAFNFLVGKVMQKTKGKGDPGRINDILRHLLRDSKQH